MKNEIIKYLKETYNPSSILLYGSYANGTNNLNSDFDCLIIVKEKNAYHDSTVVDGVSLDCFIKTKEEIEESDIDEFTTIFDAEIVLDDGFGKILKDKVLAYINEKSITSKEDKEFIREWVIKTIERFKRNDDESKFRGVMLLNESLEDYCLFRDMFYHGPKKTILYIQKNDTEAYALFHRCLEQMNEENIALWMNYVIGGKV